MGDRFRHCGGAFQTTTHYGTNINVMEKYLDAYMHACAHVIYTCISHDMHTCTYIEQLVQLIKYLVQKSSHLDTMHIYIHL